MRRLVVVLLGALVLLTGCRLDVAVEVAVRPDGSGEVAVTVVADAALLARAPGALDDLRLDDARAAGWAVDGPVAVDGGGVRVELRKPFGTLEQAAAVLAEVGPPLGRFEFRRDRPDPTTERWQVRGAAGLPDGWAAWSDAALDDLLGGPPTGLDPSPAAGLTLTVDVRLPVPADSLGVTGAVAGPDGAVRFTPDVGDGAVRTFVATGRLVDERPAAERAAAQQAWRWSVLSLVAGVLALEATAVVVWWRRRGRD